MKDKSGGAHRYDDLLDLPHHVSGTRPHMSMRDRAAQFSPFAALTGYDAAVRETARLTQPRAELDESSKAMLNEKLQQLQELLEERPEVVITYYVPDERKAGGAYVRAAGQVKKIDGDRRTIVMMDRTEIPLEQIYGIESGALRDRDEERVLRRNQKKD